MVKSSTLRISKYAKKIVGDVAKSRAESYGQEQKNIFKGSISKQVEIEIAVKKILNNIGIGALQSNYYILFAKKLESCIRKRLFNEVDIAYNTWYGRGLSHPHLRWIGEQLFHIRLNTFCRGRRQASEMAIDTVTKQMRRADLAAYWSFFKGNGNRTIDLSGWINDGIITGATWADGLIGNCLLFDGAADYVEVLSNPVLNMHTNDFSVECWVKMDQTQVDTQFPTFVSKHRADWMQGYYFLIWQGNGFGDNLITFEVGDQIWQRSVRKSIAMNDNKWHHIVGLRRGGLLELYFDGVLVEFAADVVISSINVNNDANLYLGGDPVDACCWLKGSLDEVRIWGRGLTGVEIARHYESEKPLH